MGQLNVINLKLKFQMTKIYSKHGKKKKKKLPANQSHRLQWSVTAIVTTCRAEIIGQLID